MRLKFIQVGLVVAVAVGLFTENTQAGSLRTRDGKTCVGKLELKAGNQVVVTPSSGEPLTVSFQNVGSLSMIDPVAVPAQSVDRDPQLPPPWQQADVGLVKAPGSGKEAEGVFALRGAGWGIWGGADSFHFVYQPASGDVDIVARLGDRPTEENPFVAGLAVRQGLDAAAPQAAVMMYPGCVLRMSGRPVDGSTQSSPTAGTKPYQWLRLLRAGDCFSGFCSIDGAAWVLVGTVRAKMSPSVLVGLASATTLNHMVLGTTFDHVKVTVQDMGTSEGVGLVDGSLLAGRAKSMDGDVLKYVDLAGVEHSVPAATVAHFFARPLPPDVRRVLVERKEGLTLATGDAIEGSVQGLNGGHVTVSSLLFGRQSTKLSEVAMVVMRPVKTAGGGYISTRDGSIYRCTAISVSDGAVTAEGGLAGPFTVKAEALVEACLGPGPQ